VKRSHERLQNFEEMEVWGDEMRHFQELVQAKALEIVDKWIDFFVLNKSIKPERITRKIKP